MRKGIKRNSRLLEDKTNFDREEEVLTKKRKNLVSEGQKENVPSVQKGAVVPVLAQVGITRHLDLDQESQRPSSNVIFPHDFVRIQRDGHL